VTPRLLCFSAVVPPGGGIQYARFAAALSGLRDVWALPNPGFARGELLPTDRATVIRTHAENIVRCAAGAPFALVGHSSGGWIAHAVTCHLERLGIFPAALVLLDTYLMGDLSSRTRQLFTRAWMEHIRSVSWTDDEGTAMPWYMELFQDWTPETIAAPSLFGRAMDPVPGTEGELVSAGERWPHWKQAHDVAALPGNHFTMMTDHSDSTARLVHNWLSTLEA
jgi:thioesterase domain-containing protein